MNLIPLTLGIERPEPSKKPKSAPVVGNGKLTKEIKDKIFARDDNTCQCCGFVSEKYQEIHFKNHNHSDLSDANMATTCMFCHQCFNIEKVGAMSSGTLLWLPEIDQAQLHHIARAIYVARISQGPAAEAARRAIDVLMTRREEVKNRIGTDNPEILAQVLRDYLGPKHYASRLKKLDGVRLFPLDRRKIKEADLEFNQFPQILAYWRSKKGPFGGKVPASWVEVYQDLLAA
jgi:intracellular multiplication protein IcmJ